MRHSTECVIGTDGTLNQNSKDAVRQGIDVLAIAVSNTAHAHGWWQDHHGTFVPRNMGEMIALMHSELSEALEAYRDNQPMLWYNHGDFDRPADDLDTPVIGGKPGKPEGIAAELADVIIRILDTCQTLDIPIVQALLEKHAYNITRPYRHGGKTC